MTVIPELATLITDLEDSNGKFVVWQEGESGNITGTFKDFDGTTIAKASLTAVVLTLYDEETGDVLNSQDESDILSSVATDGTLTLRLEAADNVINSTTLAEKELEQHIARFKWTWNDGVQSRSGIAEYRFRVQKLVTAS